jgi:hypothetical protein
MKMAKRFYQEYLQYQKKNQPLEAYKLIMHWAEELKIDKYFSLVEENDYRSKNSSLKDAQVAEEFSNPPIPSLEKGNTIIPTLEKGGKGGFEDFHPSPPVGEGKGEGESPDEKPGLNAVAKQPLNYEGEPAGQMAVVMYCLSALQYFDDKDLSEIQKVGFEIAMLGRQGIDPSNSEKKYHIDSIPGKEFTGLQLLAYMYAAFQVIDPFLDTGMKFKKEYEMAKEMKKGKA